MPFEYHRLRIKAFFMLFFLQDDAATVNPQAVNYHPTLLLENHSNMVPQLYIVVPMDTPLLDRKLTGAMMVNGDQVFLSVKVSIFIREYFAFESTHNDATS